MSVQRKSNPPDEPDCESTAELPALDVAVYEAARTEEQLTRTDTWIIPAPALIAPAPAVEVQVEAQSPESLEQTFETGFAAREQVLQAQQAESDWRLQTQLAERDRALALAQNDVRALEARVARYLEVLQSLEGRRTVFEEEIAGVDQKLRERDAQIASLQRELSAEQARASRLAADLAAHKQRLALLERDASTLTPLIAECDALKSRVISLEAELAAARAQTVEPGSAVDTRLARQDPAADTKYAELEAQLAQSKQHADELAGELIGARRRLEERTSALRAALDERTANLTAQLKDREATLQALLEERAAKDARVRELEELAKADEGSHRDSSGYEVVPEGAVRLLIRTDGDSEVVHVLGRKTTIGRAPESDLQIDAKFISRNHAMILAGPNHTIIEDLNSTNGVLVNNHRITRHTLKDGDSVAIGRTLFRFAVRPNRVA